MNCLKNGHNCSKIPIIGPVPNLITHADLLHKHLLFMQSEVIHNDEYKKYSYRNTKSTWIQKRIPSSGRICHSLRDLHAGNGAL